MSFGARQQTTKGIELEIFEHKNLKFIVFDIEGADS